MNKRVSFLTLVFVGLLCVLTVVAHQHGLYDRLWWYDNMMHTLGGIFLAFLGYGLLFRYEARYVVARPILGVLLFIFSVGLYWEAYEYAVQLAFPFEHIASPLDSLQDVALDMVGGIIGISFVSLIKKSYTKRNGN